MTGYLHSGANKMNKVEAYKNDNKLLLADKLGHAKVSSLKEQNLINTINTVATHDTDITQLKTDMNKVRGAYVYRGTVETEYDLPLNDNSIGDVYNISSTGMNYAWNGESWDELGNSSFVDLINDQSIAGIKTFSNGIISNVTGNLIGNASTSTKLETARSLTTKLDSTTAITFDGSAAQDAIPVTGVLAVTNGGTGSSTKNFVDLSSDQTIAGVKTFSSSINGNTATSTKLKTAISLTTKLDSNISVTFDGSSNQDAIPVTGVLTIANGGTGSSIKNFVDLTTDQSISGAKSFAEGPYGTSNAVSASTIDLNNGVVFTKTISSNITFTITGVPTGKAATFNLILTNGGAYTITWPASINWSDNTPPDLTASGIDVLTFLTPDGGITWYGTVALSGVTA